MQTDVGAITEKSHFGGIQALIAVFNWYPRLHLYHNNNRYISSSV